MASLVQLLVELDMVQGMELALDQATVLDMDQEWA